MFRSLGYKGSCFGIGGHRFYTNSRRFRLVSLVPDLMFFGGILTRCVGVPCHEISSDLTAQRIRGLSLSKAACNALLPKRSSAAGAERDRSRDRCKEIKTLITTFRYSRLDPGLLSVAGPQKVREIGGSLEMGTRGLAIEAMATGEHNQQPQMLLGDLQQARIRS